MNTGLDCPTRVWALCRAGDNRRCDAQEYNHRDPEPPILWQLPPVHSRQWCRHLLCSLRDGAQTFLGLNHCLGLWCNPFPCLCPHSRGLEPLPFCCPINFRLRDLCHILWIWNLFLVLVLVFVIVLVLVVWYGGRGRRRRGRIAHDHESRLGVGAVDDRGITTWSVWWWCLWHNWLALFVDG